MHKCRCTPRRSLPSLLMVAGELDLELERRFPDEPLMIEFCEALNALRLSHTTGTDRIRCENFLYLFKAARW
jgi:hypothetical protein